jgi:hypothetical protein
MATEPTIAAPPTAVDVTEQLLSSMAALSGVLTDYNVGSQIRTLSESIGSVNEMQGVSATALVFQGMVYGALAVFQIFPGAAVPAVGVETFSTGTGLSPPPASQNVTIPSGSIVQSIGGVQFQTTEDVLLAAGSSSVNAPIQALVGGAAGNLPPGSITQIVTNLAYPLFPTNVSGTTGGVDAETLTQTMNRFAAKVASLPASTPAAIANAAIDVSDPLTGETVLFSTLVEPWILAGSGVGSGAAGWTLYIDNGMGAASSGLIAAVNNVLGATISGGTLPTSGDVGYRDAGVPYQILAVDPIYASVAISGTVIGSIYVSPASAAMASAVSGYFTLPFGVTAEQSQLAAAVSNSALGLLTSLTVNLYPAGSGTPVSGLVCSVPYQRVILQSLGIALTYPSS